jgi:hypothetical protein
VKKQTVFSFDLFFQLDRMKSTVLQTIMPIKQLIRKFSLCKNNDRNRTLHNEDAPTQKSYQEFTENEYHEINIFVASHED